MATGSITTLGLGSGLDLQDILDQLREVDQARIDAKVTETQEIQTKADAYDAVNAKLFSLKSSALNLSLESNFLNNSVAVTDESVVSATVGDGYAAASYSIEVTQLAQRNSWQSAGASSVTSTLFADPSSGLSGPAVEAVSSDETLTIYYGTYNGLSTDSSIAAGTTDASFAINGVAIGAITVLDNDSDGALADAINALTDDHGVTASIDDDGILTLTSDDHSPIEVTMDANTQAVFGGTGDMSYTGQEAMNISLSAGMTLSEIVDEINESGSNRGTDGEPLVTASFKEADDGSYYIRLEATSGGNTQDSEINVSNFSWIAADATVGITVGESSMYLSVPPGTTYQTMSNLINASEENPGVTASVIDNGDADNPYQFILTSDETGEDARITLSNFSLLTEETGANSESLNSVFEVNGISYSRQTNAGIKDVIPGVTFNLKKTTEAGSPVELNVDVSQETVKEEIISMISGFNDLISYIKGTDSSSEDVETSDSGSDEENDNPFDGDSSARRLVSQLQSLLTTILDLDNGYTSLTDIGLEIDRTGAISIEETTLDLALADDPDAIKTLFLGDSENDVVGLADLFNDTLTEMVSSTGIASTEITEAEERIKRLDEDIENETQRLEKKYETMAMEFARLDTYISQLNSQSNAINSMIEAFQSKED